MKHVRSLVDQANLELGIAAQITSGVTSVLAGNAQLIGQLNGGAADRLGNVIGTVAGIGAAGGFGGFGGSGGAPTLNATGNTSYSPNFLSSNPWANPLIGGPQ